MSCSRYGSGLSGSPEHTQSTWKQRAKLANVLTDLRSGNIYWNVKRSPWRLPKIRRKHYGYYNLLVHSYYIILSRATYTTLAPQSWGYLLYRVPSAQGRTPPEQQRERAMSTFCMNLCRKQSGSWKTCMKLLTLSLFTCAVHSTKSLLFWSKPVILCPPPQSCQWLQLVLHEMQYIALDKNSKIHRMEACHVQTTC